MERQKVLFKKNFKNSPLLALIQRKLTSFVVHLSQSDIFIKHSKSVCSSKLINFMFHHILNYQLDINSVAIAEYC